MPINRGLTRSKNKMKLIFHHIEIMNLLFWSLSWQVWFATIKEKKNPSTVLQHSRGIHSLSNGLITTFCLLAIIAYAN